MTDKLFLKITSHRENLKISQGDILYCPETIKIKLGLNYLPQNNKTISSIEIPKYKYFKTIILIDIIALRANFDIKLENHHYWYKKIYQFFEFHYGRIQYVLKKKYNNKIDRILFIQNIISLLLEYYYETKDSRYLSLSLKLLRIHSLSKIGCFNNKFFGQYSYNIILVHFLIKNF